MNFPIIPLFGNLGDIPNLVALHQFSAAISVSFFLLTLFIAFFRGWMGKTNPGSDLIFAAFISVYFGVLGAYGFILFIITILATVFYATLKGAWTGIFGTS